MLEFRSLDYEKDIDEVVELIQEYLQPEYSKRFLVWKHLNNPIGSSYSMVATFDKRIVGVLFYMRYNFYNGNGEVITSVRPVDGCTASEMRGKGIFKKLMTACLNYYNSSFEFIMATPNSNSYPELLKLGWKKPDYDYTYKWGLLVGSKLRKGESLEDIHTTGNHKKPLSAGEVFQVGNSLEFLLWRYQDSIYKKIKFEFGGSVVYIAYRIGRIKGIQTVILCESYGCETLLPTAIKNILAKEKIYFIYYLENKFNTLLSPLFSFKHKSPLILFKGENYEVLDKLVISLGDLEGKI